MCRLQPRPKLLILRVPAQAWERSALNPGCCRIAIARALPPAEILTARPGRLAFPMTISLIRRPGRSRIPARLPREFRANNSLLNLEILPAAQLPPLGSSGRALFRRDRLQPIGRLLPSGP